MCCSTIAGKIFSPPHCDVRTPHSLRVHLLLMASAYPFSPPTFFPSSVEGCKSLSLSLSRIRDPTPLRSSSSEISCAHVPHTPLRPSSSEISCASEFVTSPCRQIQQPDQEEGKGREAVAAVEDEERGEGGMHSGEEERQWCGQARSAVRRMSRGRGTGPVAASKEEEEEAEAVRRRKR